MGTPTSRLTLPGLPAVLAGSTGVAVAMLATRWALAGRPDYAHLPYNLALAAVAYCAALAACVLERRGRHGGFQLACWVLWLAFLPNAAYLWTNVSRAFPPYVRYPYQQLPWSNLMIIPAFAWVGTLLGLESTRLFHERAGERLGRFGGWAAVLGALLFSSFGLALGRVARLNSWHLWTRPRQTATYLFGFAFRPRAHAEELALTISAFALCVIVYLGFHTLTHSGRPHDPSSR